MSTIEDVQGPFSQLIVSFFKERFPALSKDPAMTALFVGFFIGVIVTWFVYWVIHRSITNGLKGVNDILRQENRFLRTREQPQQNEFRKTEISPSTEVKKNISPLQIEHERDNPDFYWESALFKGEEEPLGKLFRRVRGKEPDPEGHSYIQRTCKVKVLNNTDEAIKDVVVKIENIQPKIEGITPPIQLRFTDEARTSIDLRPHESRFVDVIYWKFPTERVSEAEWDYQYYICGVQKDIRIKQSGYQIRLVAYGLNAHNERTFTVEKPPNTVKGICMY